MKNYLFVICFLLFVACSTDNKENSLQNFVEKRATSDTTLVFQGFTIGAPYDSTQVNSMKSSMPMTLVYEKQKYEFDHFVAIGGVGTEYEGIEVSAGYFSDFDFFGIVRLYMEKYGEPSYFTVSQYYIQTIGCYRIGTLDEFSQKPFQAQDAINMIMNDLDDNLNFSFVWEWKNQSIRLTHYRKFTNDAPVTYISYLNTGADYRKAEEAKKKSEEEAKELEEQKFLDDTKASQQI